jgi:hypothetical protein
MDGGDYDRYTRKEEEEEEGFGVKNQRPTWLYN